MAADRSGASGPAFVVLRSEWRIAEDWAPPKD